MNWIKNNWKWLVIVILIVTLLLSIQTCNNKNSQLNEKDNLITALGDTVRVWKDREGSHGESIPIRTQDPDDFINASTDNKEIQRLQALVEKYKKQLKDQGVAGVYTGETKIDTVWQTKPGGKLIDTISNKWITSRFGFDNGNTLYSLRVRDSISFVIGNEPQGWFKKDKPFALVTNYNPYSEVKEFRTYQVTTPPKKRFGIGVQVGYGLGTNFNFNPYIGVGLNYNLIEF